MSDPISALIRPGLGALGGAMSGIAAAQTNSWNQAAEIDRLNYLRAFIEHHQRQGQAAYDPLRDNLLNYLDLMRPGVGESVDPYNRAVNNMLNPDEIYGQYGGLPPELAEAAGMGGYADLFGGNADLFDQIVRGGGWSEAGGRIQDFGDSFMSGSAGGMGDLRSFGSDMLSRRGQTTNNQNASDRASEMIRSRGQTEGIGNAIDYADALFQTGGNMDELSAILAAGGGLMADGGNTAGLNSLRGGSRFLQGGTPGLTETGSAGMNVALGGLQAGGRSDITDQLAAFGRAAIADNPLMSREQAISFAREDAGRTSRRLYDKVNRDMASRFGGRGMQTALSRGDAYAAFADQAAEQEAAAIRDASARREALALDQQGRGADALTSAAGAETARLGQYGDIFGNLENAANSRYATAGGLLSDAERTALARVQAGMGSTQDMATLKSSRQFDSINALLNGEGAATQNAATWGRIGTDAEATQQGWVGQGTGALDSLFARQLGGGQLAANNLGQMNQREFNMGNLGLNARQAAQGASQATFNNRLNGMQFGNDRFNSIFGARNSAANAAGSRFASFQNAYQNGMNQLGEAVGRTNQMTLGSLGMMNAPQLTGSTNGWLNAIGGAATGAANAMKPPGT